MRIYTAYDRGLPMRWATVCKDKSLTIQSQAKDADINEIVKRFGVTGLLPQAVSPPLAADFDGVFNFQVAQNALVAAKAAFMSLDADVRYRFKNDPVYFADFCSDPKNLEEVRKLGLAPPKAEVVIPPPMKVEVVNSSSSSS